MNDTDFRMNTITLYVLSEGSIEGRSIGTILEECDTGDLVMHSTQFKQAILDGKGMADALYEAGSTPEFFQLDSNGDKIDE